MRQSERSLRLFDVGFILRRSRVDDLALIEDEDAVGEIVPSRTTAVSAKKQRELAQAIKRVRSPGLLPYVMR